MFYILILFFVGIVACFFIAKAIQKFVPKKVTPIVSIVLYLVAMYLAYASYDAVMEPIHFKKEKVKRYTEVINRLKVIRDAQAAHKTVTGTYSAKFDNLISFIDTAKFAVTRDTNMVRTVDLGGGITGEEEYRVTDTIGYTDVRASFVGKNYKDMKIVPGTQKEFSLKTGEVQKAHGDMRKVYEVKANKSDVLEGLNTDLIRQELEAEENDQVKGDVIRVGSIVDVTTNGNWPPSYDVNDVKKK